MMFSQMNSPRAVTPNWRKCVAVRLCMCAAVAMLIFSPACFGQKKKAPEPIIPPKPYVKPVSVPKVGIETSPQLFDVMCALWAAGYNTEANIGSMPPEWAAIAKKMMKMQGPATEALRAYYRDHEHNNRGTTLSRYISFAMVVGPAPNFEYTVRQEEIPPDVTVLEDF
jgi:hypothetical protein